MDRQRAPAAASHAREPRSGRQVAINRLSHVFRLSEDRQASMRTRPPEHYTADFSGDEVVTVDGFHGEPLRSLVRHALVSKVIRPSRARDILGLSASEALPFPELGELSAPSLPPLESIRRVAQAALRERYPNTDLEALRVEARDGLYRVQVVDGGIGTAEPHERGNIDVSEAGEVREVEVDWAERRS